LIIFYHSWSFWTALLIDGLWVSLISIGNEFGCVGCLASPRQRTCPTLIAFMLFVGLELVFHSKNTKKIFWWLEIGKSINRLSSVQLFSQFQSCFASEILLLRNKRLWSWVTRMKNCVQDVESGLNGTQQSPNWIYLSRHCSILLFFAFPFKDIFFLTQCGTW